MVGFHYSIFHSIPQDILKFCKNSNVPKTGHSPHFSSEKRLKTYASKSNSLLFQHSHFPGCQCSKWHSLFKVFSASFKIRCLTMSVLIKMNKKVVAIALKSNENRNRILRFKWTDMWSVQSPPKIQIKEDHFSSCSCFQNIVKVSCLRLFFIVENVLLVFFSYFFGFGPVGVNDIRRIHETGGEKRRWEKENNFYDAKREQNKTIDIFIGWCSRKAAPAYAA